MFMNLKYALLGKNDDDDDDDDDDDADAVVVSPAFKRQNAQPPVFF